MENETRVLQEQGSNLSEQSDRADNAEHILAPPQSGWYSLNMAEGDSEVAEKPTKQPNSSESYPDVTDQLDNWVRDRARREDPTTRKPESSSK